MFDFLECTVLMWEESAQLQKKKWIPVKKKKTPPGRWQVSLHTRGLKRGSLLVTGNLLSFFDYSSIRIVL